MPKILLCGSSYFAVDGILPLEAILQSPFTYVYVTVIATILAVTMWCVDGAATLKCNGYELESLLVGHLDNGSVHWRGLGM